MPSQQITRHSRSRKLKRLLKNTLLNKSYIVESRLERSVGEAARHAHGLVLDVGCGTHPYKQLLASQEAVTTYLGMEYLGATDYFGETIQNVELFGDAQHLPLKDDAVDTILCTEVIEHVPEPFALLEELWRVLRHRGILILTAPANYQIHMAPHDYFRFTKYGLEHALEKLGFHILTLQCRGRSVATIGQNISTFLYEAFIVDANSKQPRPLPAALILPLCAAIQAVALVLDRLTTSETLTLGYTVIAQKNTT